MCIRDRKGTAPGPALSGGIGKTRKKNARTKLPSPIIKETLQTLTLKTPKHLKEPKEKDEDLKTRKAPGASQRENADPKTQKRPGATQGENSNPKTQKLPGVIRGEEPRKPENCRARWRRGSQLITAAPLESSTLRWTPRENALAT